MVYHAPGTYPAGDNPGPFGILPYDNGYATPAGVGYTPQQIRAAYGVNNIFFGATQGEGQGMTIAIVDAYDNPDLVDSTAANFATSDLGVYDSTFGLPNPPSFTKVGETGGAPPTATDPTGSWEVEEALDVEMVHTIAPMANIILVEADSTADLFTADAYAATVAPVVSDSWGGPEASGEQASDSTFTIPNVTFLFSTGDSGAPGGYPAYSPDVVAVGGTSLYTNSTNGVTYETAWSTYTSLGGAVGGGGGGGTSQFETEPSYQEGVQDSGFRTIPDVSSNADPATGVAEYDAYSGGWFQVGGTSEACPVWAGYVAIADQGRAIMGGAPLTGYTQTLPALYSLPYTDFSDITVGDDAATNNAFDVYLDGVDDPNAPAKPGYDLDTGLGTAKANLLVPDLAGYGLASNLAVTTQPPASVISGDSFGLTVTVEDSLGQVDSSYNGVVTLSLAINPGGATMNPVTATAVNGVAVFDGLTLSPVNSGYEFQASAAINGLPSTTTSHLFKVIANPTPTSGSYYPATSDASLRSAISSANSDSYSSDTIYLGAGIYPLTSVNLGQLVIEDASTSVGSKTLTIIGQGANQTIIEPSTAQGFGSRVFEIISQSGATMTVIFKDLTIAGGYAGDGGVLGGQTALGGGLLIDGGMVSMTNVDLVNNEAVGSLGTAGSTGKKDQRGGAGTAGGAAQGGAFYLAGGHLTLNNTLISKDIAWGGRGGSGGMGGAGFQTGGSGGLGGNATGGAGYVASGSISGSSNLFQSNAVLGGRGGSGGEGGTGSSRRPGGIGGRGATGGLAFGAGLFVGGGSIDLGSTSFDDGLALGGAGGYGGIQGLTQPVTTNVTHEIFGLSSAGAGGDGGDAGGGGVYLSGGAVNLNTGGANTNLAQGGSFGYSGDLAFYYLGFTSAVGRGTAGFADGGGIYVNSGSLTMGTFAVSRNVADNGGAVAVATAGSVKITDGDLAGNVAVYGGAVFNYGTFTLDGGAIGANSAAIAGGIDNSHNGKVHLTSASVINNKAYSGSGGGIDNLSGSVRASNGDISDNTAYTRGGGIYSLQGSLTITGVSEVEHNTVEKTGTGSSVTVGFGGGIDVQGGTANISGATISDNSSEFGGGLFIHSGTVTITGSTISDNSADIGGGIQNEATATISDATISGNTASTTGGGIDNSGQLSITNATISDNSAGTYGGGVNNVGTISINTIHVLGNSAGLEGGGLFNAATMTIANGTISNNVSPGAASGRSFIFGRGGGIFNSSNLTLVNVMLTQNTADSGGGLYGTGGKVNASSVNVSSNTARTGDGGGIYNHNGSLTFKQGRLVDNHAAGTSVNPSYGRGGGLYQAGGKITIAGSTSSASNTAGVGSIVQNSAVQGGGIYLAGGSLTLSLAHLASNTATQSGGAIFNGGIVTLADSFVFDNAAGVDGGGIDNAGKGSALTISYSTLKDNSAGSDGGSIRNLGSAITTISTSTIEASSANLGGAIANSGTLTITTSTISDNLATDLGGGVYSDITSASSLTNSTIADNTSPDGGGGIYNQGTLKAVNVTIADNVIQGGDGGGLDIGGGGTAALFNTIVDSNTSGVGTDVFGTLAATSSNNLIGSGADGLAGTNGNHVDVTSPDLGTLTNNGGSTETIALLTGSPAIDGGANTIPGVTVPITDQRGALRGGQANSINAGAVVDIGAYEASSSFLITSAADSNILAGTLRQGLGWAADSTNDNPENLAPSPTANAPNTLVFATSGTFSTPQTITLTLGTLTIPTTHAVAIDGPGAGLVTISGGGEFQVINVPKAATAALQGITITGGVATFGGGVENLGTLTLKNTILEGNSASQDGGGLLSTGTVSITGGTISGNSAVAGGGVFGEGSLSLTSTTLSGNSASTKGGGVDFSGGSSSSSNGILTITGGTFTDNAAADGGGLYIASGTVTITGGTISGNTATGSGTGNGFGGGINNGNSNGGGGGLFDNAKGLTITGTTFTGNQATSGSGGAIDDAGGSTEVDGNLVEDAGGSITAIGLTIENNTAAIDGGGLLIDGKVTIANTNIVGNSTVSDGGGIADYGILTVTGSTISANAVTQTSGPGGFGGGIYGSNSLTVEDSTIAGNSAAVYGGGLYNLSGAATLTNTTIASNTAAMGEGGGIFNQSGQLATINATIAYNSVGSSGTGGGLFTTDDVATLYNTIVDSNTNSAGTDLVGTLLASSHNLIGGANPGLGTLTNNGGPTETIALLTGSPAIDAGTNSIPNTYGYTVPTTDQRGALRGPAGLNAGANFDIGAYEASSSYLVATGADTTDTGTLRTGVGWANVSFNDNPTNLANPAPNTVQVNTSQPISLSSTLGTLVLSNTTTAEAITNVGAGSAAISGSGAIGVLQVNTGVTAIFTSLEITAGLATTGAGINNAGTLTLDTTTVSGNSATGSGGGINNTGSLTLGDGATISGNTATSGGGINNTGTLVLGDSAAITGNSASGSGGGVLDTGTLTMDSSTIAQNTAGSGGGVDVGGTLDGHQLDHHGQLGHRLRRWSRGHVHRHVQRFRFDHLGQFRRRQRRRHRQRRYPDAGPLDHDLGQLGHRLRRRAGHRGGRDGDGGLLERVREHRHDERRRDRQQRFALDHGHHHSVQYGRGLRWWRRRRGGRHTDAHRLDREREPGRQLRRWTLQRRHREPHECHHRRELGQQRGRDPQHGYPHSRQRDHRREHHFQLWYRRRVVCRTGYGHAEQHDRRHQYGRG